jgi:hypothetical protein
MKSGAVRTGERFVFEDRGGVWEKVADARCRCVFGNRDDYGKEIDLPQDVFVFVMFDGKKPERAQSRGRVAGGGTRVVLVDAYDGSVVAEYEDVGSAMVAAMASADEIGVRLPRKRNKRQYLVMDMAVDVEENAVRVLVRLDEAAGTDKEGGDDDRDDHEGVGRGGPRGGPVGRKRDGHGPAGDVSRVSEVRKEAGGAEGKDMGAGGNGGDSAGGGVQAVQPAGGVEGAPVSGNGRSHEDGAGRDVEEVPDGAGKV